ncbi:branched-chain amino acid ABC transporter permease [Kaistia dalseonensis]|uniref:Branched-subunit amino acid ABC-type transport system permease component n=1 Tax=Kaistia dalseonensis TaxID=410840 RepID=A0ABU0H1M8_9HYPH|nr:branched-chain amino acid ABC transporter permease [Kaistia dalseonensis]MCX5493384.1 branched-chain amino acid ABC transporter permease [Kaistia dalseonensis]MDQ0435942.1 branched-subunit amino acid ABC-type transport system permease component [Kaistia dalseonensis]
MLQQLAQLTINGLITGTILGLTGVGLTLVFGIQRLANFAYGEYLTTAAYIAFIANVVFGLDLVSSALLAMAGGALLALLLHFLVLKPLRGRGLVAMSLITVGLGMMLRNVIFLVAGPQIRSLDIDQTRVFDLGLIRISPGQALAIGIAIVVAPAVALFLSRTTIGKSMRAVADNRDLAAVTGIDVERIGTYVWLLAGALAGIGGVMLAIVQGTFNPNLGTQILFLIFTTIVLGGIGNAYGALIGGVVLGLVMELSTWEGFAGGLEPRFKSVLAFVVLILLLLYRPQGLFGKERVL